MLSFSKAWKINHITSHYVCMAKINNLKWCNSTLSSLDSHRLFNSPKSGHLSLISTVYKYIKVITNSWLTHSFSAHWLIFAWLVVSMSSTDIFLMLHLVFHRHISYFLFTILFENLTFLDSSLVLRLFSRIYYTYSYVFYYLNY